MRTSMIIFFTSLLLLTACGDADETAANTEDASTATADVRDVEATAESFVCLKNWEKVRGFYVSNLLGDVDASVAVASVPEGKTYPVGTVIQLVPNEAMVKRKPGFSPASADWEFFFLNTSASGTEIVQRGIGEVMNQFGGNCLSCHGKARPEFDFVCEQGHGCDPLPLPDSVIQTVQASDPRCTQ
jgi:mono/diheme cytochrome c family protein